MTQTPLTSPLDATHTQSTLAVRQIREAVLATRAAIARWHPLPCPPDWKPDAAPLNRVKVSR